jgi:hypothetical protein
MGVSAALQSKKNNQTYQGLTENQGWLDDQEYNIIIVHANNWLLYTVGWLGTAVAAARLGRYVNTFIIDWPHGTTTS